jgi:hypothetical protein
MAVEARVGGGVDELCRKTVGAVLNEEQLKSPWLEKDYNLVENENKDPSGGGG